MSTRATPLALAFVAASALCCHRAESGPSPADPVPERDSSAVARMPLISRGMPAFANHSSSSSSPASAFDADYGTAWSSGHKPTPDDPDWIAIDLSSVPAARRSTVYSVWFNEAGYQYDSAEGSSYQLPGDLEIQSNTRPGGGRPPSDGWVTLASRKGNTLSSGADLLHVDGANWLRLFCKANAPNTGQMNFVTTIQWDLFDGHESLDAWKFIGDSITANSMGHKKTNDSFNQLVARHVPNFPAFEMAGHGFWKASTALAAIDAYLANFPGKFVGLSLGTNDSDPDTYRADMTKLIDRVIAAGKQPVLPTIPYTGEPNHVPVITKLNDVVRQLYTQYATKLVVGPDLYQVLYDGRATMFDQPADLHPNEAGNAAIRRAWADAAAARVYGK
ncbi:MAG TPA: SGNH/GDSL hydrolase family protein [Polyangiaceae bacterium]